MKTRRRFIQQLSLTAASLPFVNLINACAMNSQTKNDDKVLRVAIMGLGGYGTRVAEAMQSCTKAKLVGVISGTPAKITAWQKKYNIPAKNCYNYENYDSIKNNPDIDAVYVITPNALHHDAVIRIAKAGKHAICEKPMAVDARQ